MKKRILPIIALALSATACVSDADLDVADNKGYINVSVSADNSMETRAVQTVSDFSGWTIRARKTEESNDIMWSSEKAFAAGVYTVKASNYPNEAESYTANSNWGAAYYYGSASGITVTAGGTAQASIDCGKASNARMQVTITETTDILTNVSLEAKNEAKDRTLTFTASTNNDFAYFKANETVSYTLKYTYKQESEQKTKSGTIDMKGPATTNIISVSANSSGLINVTIKYDDEFGTGNSSTITIDAATGNEVNSQE